MTITGTITIPQLEAGSFATSPIVTAGAQVTRTADQASMTGTNFSSWYNQAQGTFYVEANVVNIEESPYLLNSSNLTTTLVYQYVGPTGVLNTYEGSHAASISSGYTSNDYHKSINTYSSTSNAMTITFDGKTVNSSAYSGAFSTATGINIMRNPYVPGSCGHIRKINYYATALPSAVLQSLTS